jgi:hypothetical protein
MGFVLYYTVDHASADALVTALREKEVKVAHVDTAIARRLGTDAAVGTAAGMLMANGVGVVISSGGNVDAIREACGFLMPVGPAGDIPTTAIDTVMETLTTQGYLGTAAGAYSAEEEEEIRKRLQDLGYL